MEAEILERRKQIGKRYNHDGNPQKNLQNYIYTLSMCTYSTGHAKYFEEYKAVAFPLKDRLFPIKLKPQVDPIEEDKQNQIVLGGKVPGNNPNLINLKLVELVKMMHGSFESKQKIIDDFHQKHPECSKKSIERKMRELFEKDKKSDEPRQRWFATESTLVELNLTEDEELKALFRDRLKVVMDEISKVEEEKQRAKEEHQKLKEERREEKRAQKELLKE